MRKASWFILIFSFLSSYSFATDYTITVTAAGNSDYIFNSSGLQLTNSNDPDISVNVGDKLIFDVTSSSLASHPFAIVSALDGATSGYNSSFLVSGIANNGENGVVITWDLSGVSAGEYYYVCVNHPSMRGKITVNSTSSGIDSDGDGVDDEDDLDDDNDGITDILEGGETLDTDGDGLPNRIDPDSDGDNCNDVVEAGYGDLDGDGILGVAPYKYTTDGLVDGAQAYKVFSGIDDLDGNGTKDFLEAGTALSKTSDPSNLTVLEYSTVKFTGSGTTVDNVGTITYAWQITTDNGDTWLDVSNYVTSNPNHPGNYSGIDSTTLVIDSVTAAMDKFGYRLFMETPAYKCDADVTTNRAQLGVYKLDTDGDKVPDETDLDDDNDGILDAVEGGETLDTDGDGVPNRLDTDSDGDGCLDVDEAGITTDENNDGKVGIPIIVVDAQGRVTSSGSGSYSYATPADMDGNGTYDFLEANTDATVTSSPTSLNVGEFSQAKFVASGESDGSLGYIWQVSTDDGTTFTDIETFDNVGEQPEVMILGGGMGYFNKLNAFIELYVNADIPASKYSLVIKNQSGTAYTRPLSSAKAGQYYVIYDNQSYFTSFFGSFNSVYGSGNHVTDRWTSLDALNNDIIVEIQRSNDGLVVDRFGSDVNSTSVDEAYPWSAPMGFFKRRDNIYSSSEFDLGDWTICSTCLDNTTNATSSTPYAIASAVLPATSLYSGYDDDTLVINSAPLHYSGYQYRAKVRTLNRACDNGSFSEAANLVVFKDSDGDGVGDADDLDDDNDGILDSEEGADGEDFDGDGIPNSLDLDSDGDGCLDVVEAGFTDADADGLVGEGTPTVNGDGTVSGHTYSDPQDLDGNSQDDYLDAGSDARVNSHPESLFADEEDDTIFVASAGLSSSLIFFESGYPNSTSHTLAYMNSNPIDHRGWYSTTAASTFWSVVEFNTLTDDIKSGLTYLLQSAGHSYYLRRSTENFQTASDFAESAGGYLFIINSSYEAELVREAVRENNSNVNFWVNHFRDVNAEGYVQNSARTGWVSGIVPNSDVTYQWQVSDDDGVSWSNVTDGANYSGSTNDTLRVKAIPASFNGNQYRVQVSATNFSCSSDPVHSNSATLTVSSDPDNDGVKNSEDLDDDNDGILDVDEGGKTLDTDGDGIPNRLDLDSDDDGCLDAEEAGFSGFDEDGRLCADASCANADGTVTGHDYDTEPLDGDNNGVADYLEAGSSPTITSDLGPSTISPNGSSSSLIVTSSISDIPSPSLSYTNWAPNEPNTADNGQMNIFSGKWNATYYYYSSYYIVEFNSIRDDAISGFVKLLDYQGHSYYRSNSIKNWTNANNDAKSLGGYLVRFESETENTLVWEAAKARSTSHHIWIGLYQNTSSAQYSEPSGGWEWSPTPSTISYTWQVSSDGGENFTDITSSNSSVTINDTTITYTGFTSNSLEIDPVIYGLNDYQYRVILTNPGFKCAVADTSTITTLVVRDDFDGDGIRDEVDADDDNDGIWDVNEGDGTLDTDGDGKPDSQDLDSDNDGCSDVDEAYGTGYDSNGDRIFGGENPTISSNGSVSGSSSSQTGLDQDANGVKDFQEAGSAITDVSCPEDITAPEGSSVEIITSATGQGETSVSYSWQVSYDSTNWVDISDAELMFLGIGQAQYSTSYEGEPQFIELVALKDIPNLNKYRVYNYQNGNTSYSYYYDLSGSANKGDIILLHYSYQFDNFFETKQRADYDLAFDAGNLIRYGIRGGDDAFTLVDGNKGQDDIVDMIGRRGEDGTDKAWDYSRGWMRRKANLLPRESFSEGDWTVCKDCFMDPFGDRAFYHDRASASGRSEPTTRYPQTDYTFTFDYSRGDTLVIDDISQSFSGYQFRAIASTPSYVCGENDTTCAVTVTVVGDFDRDGIPDATDIDDDNDGILDSVEGEDTDTDGDGILDKFDLDSDGDGCNDVDEAGFSDPDADGVLGTGSPTVTDEGAVEGHEFTAPLDGDGNGVLDYLEKGSSVSITDYADYYLSEGGDTAVYWVDYDVTGPVRFQWQVSKDTAKTWSNISASDAGVGDTGDTEVCESATWGVGSWKWTAGDLVGLIDNINSGVDATITVTDSDQIEWVNDYPKVENSTFGGIKTLGIGFDPKAGSGTSSVTTTVAFTEALNGLTMLLTDIDASTGKWKDKVVITSDAGDPTVTAVNANPSFTVDGNTVLAKEFVESNADNLGTARLVFPSGVTTVTFVYTDESGLDDPDDRGIGITFEDICINSGSATYEGVFNDTLQIYDVKQGMDEWRYRLRILTPAYACEDTVFSQPARLDVVSDWDNDGVPNNIDVDDDNDGILDVDEGEGDLDNDGIKNRFDLDSDGDGCYDVTEAGFTDNILDGTADGILGDNKPYTVDEFGKITSGLLNDGYTTPNDLDENGSKDFLQFGQNVLNGQLNGASLEMLSSGSGSFKITASVPSGDKILYQWQESRDGGNSWFDVPETAPYSGTKTNELTLTQPDPSLTGYKYRVLLTIPSYVCAVIPLNLESDLTVYPDNDKDGVRDSQDDDDDNDGILDTYEGTPDQDNDQDGIPNRFDDDSDGDGCLDVIEAGFTDFNGDGYLGPDDASTIFIDSLNSTGASSVSSGGRINSFGGYTVPADLDGNGVYDFLEEGADITAIECPDSLTVDEGGTATFNGEATVESGTINYQWEISRDSGDTWTDFSEAGLMFVGAGQGYYSSSDEGRPKFIELIATQDIADLSDYRIYSHQNGTTSADYSFTLPQESIRRGQMILLYYSSSYFNAYFNTNLSTSYAKQYYVGNTLRYGLRGGDDAFTLLWKRQDGNNNAFNVTEDVVDMLGVKGEDGTGKDWDYYRGWLKRKSNKFRSKTFKLSDWTVCKECLGTVSFNSQAQTPYTIASYSTNQAGFGSQSKTLTLNSVSYDDYHGALVRVKVSTPAYACGEADTSCVARISVIPIDSDGDGVPDRLDSDDDNDGISDEDEGGETLDTDGDGIPNRIDEDSDDDGCLDVLEAGFEDPDGDGILGTGTPSVDSEGKIDGHTYDTPQDADSNSVPDFLQVSSDPTITSQPISIIRQGGDDGSFSVTVDGDETITYQWQVSEDSLTWENLVDGGFYSGSSTATLSLTAVTEDIDGFYYRVVVETPALSCSEPVISEVVRLTAKDDSDGDGIKNFSDLDSDNDGILNSDEGAALKLDTDGDGIPDFLDLDSDNDGCYDVVEAGYEDPDADGRPGTGDPNIIPVIGLVDVAGHEYGDKSGYDSDDNGVKDFQEAGGPVTSVTSPSNKLASQGTSVSFTASGTATSPLGFQWQLSEDNGQTWTNLTNESPYSGTDEATFTINPVALSMNSTLYRAIVSTPGFACGDSDTTQYARLIALPDNDGDGIQDLYDEDDDNDGILDVDEFIDDIDGDGIPNSFDRDSDGDNCFDVIEAGFLDPNGDGILGDSVDVDGDGKYDLAARVGPTGRVINWTGYTTPNDLDGNSVRDYLEAGSQAVIDTDPPSTNTVSEFSNFELFVSSSSDADMKYQWQVSDDCETWTDLSESPDLIITGVFETKSRGYQGLELYAVRDIEDLSKYGISVSNTTTGSSPNQVLTATSLDAGQYFMIYYSSNWKNFFSTEESSSYKEMYSAELYSMSYSDRHNIVLYDRTSGSWEKVDIVGDESVSSSLSDWDVEEGWLYRKNGRGASKIFIPGDWNIKKKEFSLIGATASNGNDISQNSYPLFRFTGPSEYRGVDNDTLLIVRTPLTLNDKNFRVVVSTPGYVCGDTIYSECANLTVEAMSDTDGDGIPDYVDLDSDNDGIPDIIEGCDVDTDGDGVPNCLDLDSDGDGCDDVVEAGFTDDDGDGKLGPNDLFVDVNGLVSSGIDGYTDPSDLDFNGINDFLEAGDTVEILTNPSTVNVLLLDDTIFVGSGTSSSIISQRWQQSDDGGTTFRTLNNTPSVIITGVLEGYYSSRPKIIEFKAIRDVPCLKDYRVKVGSSYITLGNTTTTCEELKRGEFYYLVYTYSNAYSFLLNSGPRDDFDLSKYKYDEVSTLNSQLTGVSDIILEYARDGYGTTYKEVDKVLGSGDDSYNLGWKYKKDTTQVSTYFKSQDWVNCEGCLVNESTNISAGSGNDDYRLEDNGDTTFFSFPLASYGNPVIISGVNSDTLRVENIPYTMNGYKFNLEMQTPGFACDPDVSTDVSTLNVFLPDFDNDGYVDKLDLDADNDGILDIHEDTTDIDGDGFPNYIDLDSDNDGCPDAVEAGFTDPDGDGYLGNTRDQDGNLILRVDENGVVLNQGGYSTPPAVDLDENGVYDFQEAGTQVEILRQPSDQVFSTPDEKFFVEASSDAVIFYQWQILEDTSTEEWSDMRDTLDFSDVTTDTLRVANVLDYSANKFRVMLTTPGYSCGDTIYSDPVALISTEDWDEDGYNDIIDLDDDNDGILDILEGDTIDTDGDGIPNSKDLDSDGDGCYDVVEAGFVDEDDDGVLGTAPDSVTVVGTVVWDPPGYTTPADVDENGVFDHLEIGSVAVIHTVPVNDTIQAGTDATFTGSFTAEGLVTYQWEYSTGKNEWVDVPDTLVLGNDSVYFSGVTDSTLTVRGVPFTMNDYLFRLVATTPTYVCGPDVPSEPAAIKLAGDNDKDGIIDIIDLDDDNDGILDVIEGGGDTDGDGIPDWFDLDSDNDGCNDVEEAGFEDPDNDGVLCTSPVVVDVEGKVVCIADEACDDDPITNMSWYQSDNSTFITDTVKSPGYYRLTPASSYSRGSVFRDPNNGMVDLRGDFVIKAELYFGNRNNGSGIAFHLAKNNYTSLLSSWGQMGMQFNNALSVEFDTHYGGNYDIQNDHSSLHINGNNIAGTDRLGVTQSSSYSNIEHSRRPINIIDLGEDINDGKWKEFTFSWNAYSKTITVDFEGQQIMTYQVDLVKDVLSGSNLAYFGFTSDNYNVSQEQRVYIKSICEVDASSGESIFKGYKDPSDLDEDGVYDFQQKGDVPEFSDSYEDDEVVIVKVGEDTTFVTSVEYEGSGDVVWQMCNEDCSECTIIQKSPGLMMTGIFRGDIGGVEPSVIELYALEDIADLSVYGIEIARDGSDANGQDYKLAAVALDSGEFYTISSNDLYHKSWFAQEPSQQSFYNNFDGDDAIILYKGGVAVDVFGSPGKDGSGELWDYTLGWAYRKDGRISSPTFNVSDWKTCRGCSLGSNFNDEMSNPFPLGVFAGAPTFSGVDTDTLTLHNATPSLDGTRFRRAVIDPSYVCLPEAGGDCIILGIFLDNDNDGIIDEIDLDDDNDGILDTLETEGDTDGDGIPNHFDLDSDNDGCYDAVEAGFTDGDDDGILGDSPETVDSLGLVTSGVDGYTLPADNDGSGGYDFLEFGTVAVLVSSPDTTSGTEGSDLYFVAKGTAVGGSMTSYPFDYQDWSTRADALWESSSDRFMLTIQNTYRTGQIWNTSKIQIDRGFVISSDMNFGEITDNGARGIAFVLQNVSTSAYGSHSDNFGYSAGNISNAFAVEIDTRPYADNLSANSIRIVSLKNNVKTVIESKDIPSLKDGTYKNVSISWDPNTKVVTIFLNGLKIVSGVVNLSSEIFGSTSTYFGFTSATGAYRNYHYIKNISLSGTLQGDESGNVIFDWQVSSDSAATWVDITEADSLIYRAVKNDTLFIDDASKELNGYVYRARVRNPSYACDPGVFSQIALLQILPDNDKDGIPDDIDVDDDNDGILDTKEGMDDLDGDGIPNHFDLDSDNDGCFDVIEAGFDDNDYVFGELDTLVENVTWYHAKWDNGEPNNTGDNEHFAHISTADTYNDNYETTNYSHILEVVYPFSENIDGYTWIGDFNLHSYYVSTTISSWTQAKAKADAVPGGHLVVFSSEEEHNFVAPKVGNAWIGLYQDLNAENYSEPDSGWVWVPSILRPILGSPDGILGNSPVKVDEIGRVIQSADGTTSQGYFKPKDGDANGVEDYREVGSAAVITVEPVTDRVDGGDTIVLGTVVEVIGNAKYEWYESRDTGKVWIKLPPFHPYSGVDTDTLTILGAPLSMNGFQYKMVVSTPAYACGVNDTTSNIPIKVSNDNDEDGIPNEIDIDDDNDGIVDTLEVVDSENDDDFDNDGIPNHYDLDADGDGCPDVIEAGFNDPDGDWILGTSPVVVNNIGQVLLFDTNGDGVITPQDTVVADTVLAGYIYPRDADSTDVYDFKEDDDFTILFNTHPADIQVPDKTDGFMFVDVAAEDSIVYQWYSSKDTLTWTMVEDDTIYIERENEEDVFDTLIFRGATSDTLFILGADTLIDSTYYKVVVNIPSQPCAEETSSYAALFTVVTDIDLDNDGIPNSEEGYGDLDGDGIPNYLDLDSDNDGIPDVIEGGDGALDTNGDGMIDENDEGFSDDDEDGMADASEETPTPDTDADGKPDYLDIDSDNDGIFDVLEGGDGDLDTNADGMIDSEDEGFADEDNDGMADASEQTEQPDYDGDGRPDYLDIDSDNDGIFDVVEGGDGVLDTNGDGVIDSNDEGYTDEDADGMDDDSEATVTPDTDGDSLPDYLDLDSDNDGIHDVVEGGDGSLDTNGDGVIDSKDTGYADADADGMDDTSESTAAPDTDGDQRPDYLDIDSDNDGIFDVVEGGDAELDTNEDGVIDSNDTGFTDVDEDGMDDDSEATPVPDTDGDELPDYQDIDSDNDGIFDIVEGGDGDLDTDANGMIDANDEVFVDEDGDGMDDASELTPVTDSDSDSVPNFQDIDSDNDGIFDVVEGGDAVSDTNGDGMIDNLDEGYTDLDGDGMDDDTEATEPLDSDGDGQPNYLDLDSDNDGIHDVVEGGDASLDTNGDGVIDSNDTGYADADADGMDDASELTPVTQTDADDLPDYLDLDSDNDGIQDVIEGGDGALDTNNDGVIDSNDTGYADADADGMDDASELTPVTQTDADDLPDFQDIDSDNDGIFDVVEGGDGALDTNNDGVIDADDEGFADDDADGMEDSAELTGQTNSDGDTNPDYIDLDSDNDGIHDVTENGDGVYDTNNDGAVDSGDSGYSDDDNDGMDDDTESTDPYDSDGDSLPNHLDLDSDNDGIYDVVEGGDAESDTNGDGVINSSDDNYLDQDADGMDDTSESTPVTNTDNDLNADFVDLDSDNDGIQDVIEGGDGALDTNGDGRIDVSDTDEDFTFADEDNDGMADVAEDTEAPDSDADGTNDYQDLDADNDGIFDVIEGGDGINADLDGDGVNEFVDLDTNNDGMIDSEDTGYVDADNDGMADSSEGTGQPNSDVTEDLDDGIPNYLDLDSDDDGCNDVVEAGFSDVDGDGILGEGIPEVDRSGLVITEDGDGYTDPLDADNNGILDLYYATELDVVFETQPEYAGTVFQGENVTYNVIVEFIPYLPADIQWQRGVISDDGQDTVWTDIENGVDFSGVETNTLTINNVTFTKDNNTLYRAKVTARGYSCALVFSDEVKLDIEFRELHIPQGFSPNYDGINDNWYINGIDFYPNNTVQIYNRWEVKVFEMEGYQNNDPSKNFYGVANYGNTNGKLLPETVYFYVIDLGETDVDGNPVEDDIRYRKGIVYIRRGNE